MKLVILAVAILLALHGCVGSTPQTENQTTNQTNASNGITQEMCQNAGGHWNPQGTCCRNLTPGTVCNKFCVAVCDCGGIAGFQCPGGFVCSDLYPSNTTPDAMGVCKKASE